MNQVVAELRALNGRVAEYALPTALTRTAKLAQPLLREEMGRVFDNPVPYTLNSLFVQPATRAQPRARVMVKDRGTGKVAPERYLLSEVLGGGRGRKGLERGLQGEGALRPGEYAMPGQGLRLNAAGNMTGAQSRRLLSGAKSKAGGMFVGAIGGQRGLWQRVGRGRGRSVKPLLAFVTQAPAYRARLDFEGVAERAARAHFEPEFRRAFGELRAKFR